MSWLESARRIVNTGQFEVLNPETGDPIEATVDFVEDENGDTQAVYATSGEPLTTGVVLDLFSATVMVQVHDALSPHHQEQFTDMPLVRAHKIAFQLMQGRVA